MGSPTKAPSAFDHRYRQPGSFGPPWERGCLPWINAEPSCGTVCHARSEVPLDE